MGMTTAMLEMIPSCRFDVSLYYIIIAGVVGDRVFYGWCCFGGWLCWAIENEFDVAALDVGLMLLFLSSRTNSKSKTRCRNKTNQVVTSLKSSIRLQQYCRSTW